MILAAIQDINFWLYTSLYIIYFITVISTIVVILSENRNPVKSIAWIVVLLFLPVVGIVFYFFFGQEYRRQRMISRKGKRKLLKNINYSENEVSNLPLFLSSESIQEIKLGYALGEFIPYPGNKVTIFTEGESKFDMLKSKMRKARKFIHLQYYIFNNDKLGNEIKQILIEKAREGIEVRVSTLHLVCTLFQLFVCLHSSLFPKQCNVTTEFLPTAPPRRWWKGNPGLGPTVSFKERHAGETDRSAVSPEPESCRLHGGVPGLPHPGMKSGFRQGP